MSTKPCRQFTNEQKAEAVRIVAQSDKSIAQIAKEMGLTESALRNWVKQAEIDQRLFHCYDIEALPRTNNDLEQLFGCWRHHQRRCTGRKVAPASVVVRGSVQIVAAIATQTRSFSAADLATVSIPDWQALRAELNSHQHKRNRQRQFRRSPAAYLADLEQKALQLALPS